MSRLDPKLVGLHNTRIVLDGQERRASYRVNLEDADGVQLVLIRNGQRIPGVALDISATGTAVCVQAEHVGELRAVADGSGPGGWVIGLMTPALEAPLSVPALARYVGPMEGGVRLGFAFALNEDRRTILSDKLRALFNQRQALRARPGKDENVPVELITPDDFRLVGVMRDLSLLGMGVLVGVDDEALLGNVERLQVRATLPGPKVLAVPMRLHYRMPLGLPDAAAEYGAPAVHLGMSFERGALRSARAMDLVGAFVMRQQRRMQREQNAAAEAAAHAAAGGDGGAAGT